MDINLIVFDQYFIKIDYFNNIYSKNKENKKNYIMQTDPLVVVIIGLSKAGKQQVAEMLVEKFQFKQFVLEQQQEQTAKNISNLVFTDFHGRKVYVLRTYDPLILKTLKKRNFINVILVECPSFKRFEHYLASNKLNFDAKINTQECTLKLRQFIVQESEQHTEQYVQCLQFVRVRLFNIGDRSFLQKQITSKKQSIIKPFRPTWNEYFMKIADIARRRSNCMKSSVGAVIVNQQNRVISTGYNGTPKGLPSCFNDGCDRCNKNQSKSLDQCMCLHAQQSAIIQVGIGRTVGCKLYTTLFPCFSCAKIIKQAGIQQILYLQQYNKEDSGKLFLQDNFDQTKIKQIKIDNIYY